MRNKGFFWFFTILLLVVSLYQISFSFIGSGIEKEADQLAIEKVEELKANTVEGDSAKLPNGTYVNFDTDREAYDLAKAAFINELLKEKNDEVVFLGNTYNEVKDKSVSLGLDLEGGMSVTLELSMSDLVKNAALNPRDLHFLKPYESALEEYNSLGGDFIDLFVAKHQEMFPERLLIREFSTDEVVSKISNRATNEETKRYLKSLSEGALDGVETIMENHINQFGVAQPNITKDVSTNRLYIELPGVKDQATVRERLQSTANLEFYLTYKGLELGGFFNELLVEDSDELSNDEFEGLFSDNSNSETDSITTSEDDTTALSLMDELAIEDKETESTGPQLSSFGKMFQVNIGQDNNYLDSPRLGFAKAGDTSKINVILNEKAEELMMENIRFVWGAKKEELGISDTAYYSLYALKIPEDLKARVGGTDIENARLSIDPNQSGRGVSIDMSDRGAEEWGRMTSENIGNFIAITMDNKVYSAPIIQSAITGGQTLISGNFTIAEAQGLTNLLNAGALPAPCVIVDEAVVGPTIGAENSRAGLMSFGFALALVLTYMMVYYGRAGLIVNTALIINVILIVGFLAAFGAVLTLAGIAGIVLTIGMSIDANILIYERIREEIREGKGMKVAIKDGYSNALSSIIDANVTTLLVAVILKVFGTGPIESFATTLIIGIFTSVFTAVVVTRLIFESQIKKNKSFAFSTPMTKNAFVNVDIKAIKNRKKFYILSSILVLGSIIAISTRGLKPSVEFSGGSTFEVVFDKPIGQDIESLNAMLRNALVVDGVEASVEVKVRNSDYRVEIATDYLVNTPNSSEIIERDLMNALEDNEERFGSATIENSRSVSPSISSELQRSSTIAVILSLMVVFTYIFVRFGKWQYGFASVIALAHDVIIVLGLFALLHGVLPFNMEVDQAFIAAILTVIGYSINDTVIVFDRIREYLAKYRRKSQKEVINSAINSTISRTVNTSLSTSIVLLTIFVFDGGAIKGFVFALMIGVVVGTYSSICVASPIVTDLLKDKKDKPEEIEAV